MNKKILIFGLFVIVVVNLFISFLSFASEPNLKIQYEFQDDTRGVDNTGSQNQPTSDGKTGFGDDLGVGIRYKPKLDLGLSANYTEKQTDNQPSVAIGDAVTPSYAIPVWTDKNQLGAGLNYSPENNDTTPGSGVSTVYHDPYQLKLGGCNPEESWDWFFGCGSCENGKGSKNQGCMLDENGQLIRPSEIQINLLPGYGETGRPYNPIQLESPYLQFNPDRFDLRLNYINPHGEHKYVSSSPLTIGGPFGFVPSGTANFVKDLYPGNGSGFSLKLQF